MKKSCTFLEYLAYSFYFEIVKTGINQKYDFSIETFDLQGPKWVCLIEKMSPIIFSLNKFIKPPLRSRLLFTGLSENPVVGFIFLRQYCISIVQNVNHGNAT